MWQDLISGMNVHNELHKSSSKPSVPTVICDRSDKFEHTDIDLLPSSEGTRVVSLKYILIVLYTEPSDCECPLLIIGTPGHTRLSSFMPLWLCKVHSEVFYHLLLEPRTLHNAIISDAFPARNSTGCTEREFGVIVQLVVATMA